jgi:hypothetical protein
LCCLMDICETESESESSLRTIEDTSLRILV